MRVAGAGRGQHEGVHLESVPGAGQGQQLVLGVDLATRGQQRVVTLGATIKTRAANIQCGMLTKM